MRTKTKNLIISFWKKKYAYRILMHVGTYTLLSIKSHHFFNLTIFLSLPFYKVKTYSFHHITKTIPSINKLKQIKFCSNRKQLWLDSPIKDNKLECCLRAYSKTKEQWDSLERVNLINTCTSAREDQIIFFSDWAVWNLFFLKII